MAKVGDRRQWKMWECDNVIMWECDNPEERDKL
jgi:hypothetical protein